MTSPILTVISILRQGRLDPVHLDDSYGSAEPTGAGSDLREFQLAWGMREVLIECPWFEVGRPSVQSGSRLLGRLRRHDDGTVQRVVVDAIGTFLLGEIRP